MPRTPKPQTYEAEQLYSVTLKDRATVLGETLYPGREYDIRGEHLTTIADAVLIAEPVEG
jgi:hypothetical protein